MASKEEHLGRSIYKHSLDCSLYFYVDVDLIALVRSAMPMISFAMRLQVAIMAFAVAGCLFRPWTGEP